MGSILARRLSTGQLTARIPTERVARSSVVFLKFTVLIWCNFLLVDSSYFGNKQEQIIMSKGLVRLIKKHPRLIGEYRAFVVKTMLDNEAKRRLAGK